MSASTPRQSSGQVELADIFRAHGGEYLERFPVSFSQQEVMRSIVDCKTAACGGHLYRCTHCKREIPRYNSCQNRHCPKCQGRAAARWAAARGDDLLPTHYFHTVFTIPHSFNPLILRNKKLVFNLFFRAVRRTLLQVGAKNLGAKLGFFMVLHSWGQKLDLHPHIHCVICAGGPALDGSHWVQFRENFFLPNQVLSDVFRGKFIQYLKRAYRKGQLEVAGSTAYLRAPDKFSELLDSAVKSRWVVHTKDSFAAPELVVKYLARYTHRVAIANQRIRSLDDGSVTFSYKDYAQDGKRKRLKLSALEFIRRFLLHTLPKNFTRIRHAGFLAARNKKLELPRAEMLMKYDCRVPEKNTAQDTNLSPPDTQCSCPFCKIGTLVPIAEIKPRKKSLPFPIAPPKPPPLSAASSP